MKNLILNSLFLVVLSCSVILTGAPAVDPSFTFQGRYEVSGTPFNGQADMGFSLWDAAEDGAQIGDTQVLANVEVTNGLFSVILNAGGEFGPDAFNGEDRWLQIEECTGGNCETSNVLTPRQMLTAVPYATNSSSSPWSGITGIPDGFADGVDNSGDSLWANSENDISYSLGNVGIGTLTPEFPLTIRTADGMDGLVHTDGTHTLSTFVNQSGCWLGTLSAHSLHFFTGLSNPQVTLNTAGGFGIGTTTAIRRFHTYAPDLFVARFEGTDSVASVVEFRSSSSDTTWEYGVGGSNPGFGAAAGTAYFFRQGNLHPAIAMATDNRVGMGTWTPDPASRLNVVQDVAGAQAVRGDAPQGNAVVGTNARPGYAAVAGLNSAAGVENNFGALGVYGEANQGNSAIGVYGKSTSGTGVLGSGDIAVLGQGRVGVFGTAVGPNSVGVRGVADAADSSSVGGVFDGLNVAGQLYVNGELFVFGTLTVVEPKLTQADHPLDPENKYLTHASVDSPEALNVYSGNTATDENGVSVVTLPDYFEAFNKDFRYQLTVIGDFAQAVVSKEIENNTFEIKTDRPNVKVSWQVTGVRNDAYAKANPFEVEQDKTPKDRGKYLSPEVFGQPKEKGIYYDPPVEELSSSVSSSEKQPKPSAE